MTIPRPSSLRRMGAAIGVAALLATACGSDDGAAVRNLDADGETSASASASASSSGSTSGSASASAPAAGSTDATPTTGDGGYEYASNVDSHRLVVLDICGIGDLLDAGDFDAVGAIYRDGENSVKSDGSIRTIGGFAAGEDKQHGLDAYYGTATPLDDFVSAALEGSGIFEGASDAVRGQGVEKGIQNQTMVAWTVHELNAALAKAADGNFDIQEGAVHNWDEGWAFYHGAEGGCAPWATANKRAGNFATTTDGDLAQANANILQAMIDGRDALVAEDMAGAETAAAEVVRNVVITYSQAAIRYASLIEGDLAEGEDETAKVHQAEGLAFWRVIESIVAGAGADTETVNEILDLASDPGANGFGGEIRTALEPAWEELGISADEIGTLQ